MLLETSERRVETIERQLARVPRVVLRQHLQVKRRRLVAGEPDVSHLALLTRAVQNFDDASPREMLRRLIVEHDFVNLPEIEVIRAQAPQ